MKQLQTLVLLLLLPIFLFSQKGSGFTLGSPSSPTIEGCDTTTNKEVSIEFAGALTCCFEVIDGQSWKRPCDNVVLGECSTYDCCTFQVNSNRNGVSNSNFYSEFEYGAIKGDTWADFLQAFQFQGGIIESDCPDGGCNVTNYQFCNYTYHTLTYLDENGIRKEIPTSCSIPKEADCKKSKTLYTVYDNAGTSWENENIIRLHFTDGTFEDFTQPVITSGTWTGQLQNWDDNTTAILEKKCSAFSVETRFNPSPFNSTDLSTYTPPDGLLVPPSELWGRVPTMAWRYLQVSACATCPAINSVELVNVNGTALDEPLLMTFAFVEGLEKRYDVCKECVPNEGIAQTLYYQGTTEIVPQSDYPVCLFECNEAFPPIPESGCNFTTEIVCDNRGTNDLSDDITITLRYQDCGDGKITATYFIEDANQGLVVYDDLQDPNHVVICGTNEPVIEPEPECENAIPLGVLWKFMPGEIGATTEYWQPTALGGTAAPHGDITDIFVNNGTELVHPNAPSHTAISTTFGYSTASPTFLDLFGFTDRTQTSGTDQVRQYAYVYLSQDGVVNDNNLNTGERGILAVNECCESGLNNKAVRNTDSAGGDAFVFNGVSIQSGLHYIDIGTSDLSARQGFNLTFTGADGQTLNVTPYRTKPYFECINVYKCMNTGLLYNAVTDEQITIEENDTWCEPTCSAPTSSTGATNLRTLRIINN